MVPFFNSVGTTLNVKSEKSTYDCVLKNNLAVCDGRERQRERHRTSILHTRTLYERMRKMNELPVIKEINERKGGEKTGICQFRGWVHETNRRMQL